MKLPARVLRDDPILSDRAASYFGGAGQTFLLRAKLRASGTLVLLDDRLVYDPDADGDRIEIPVSEIHRLGMGRWNEGTGMFAPVLKITYRKNLVFGVQVARPERWLEAIEETAGRHHVVIQGMRQTRSVLVFRRPRVLVALFLLLILLVSAVPQFFLWRGAAKPFPVRATPAGSAG